MSARLAVTLSVLVVAAFVLASVAFFRGHQNASHDRATLCHAQNAATRAVRSILLLAQASTRPTSPQRAKEAADFYRRALAEVKPIDCSTVAN